MIFVFDIVKSVGLVIFLANFFGGTVLVFWAANTIENFVVERFFCSKSKMRIEFEETLKHFYEIFVDVRELLIQFHLL